MKTKFNQWIDAKRLPNYAEIYSAVVSIAGEGEAVTPKQVGKEARHFAFDDIRMVILRGTEVLYSMDSDGSVDAEFVGNFVGNN